MSIMTAPLFSFLNDKGNKSYNSILQVRKELSVRPTHNKRFHPVAVKEIAVDVMVKTGVRARREGELMYKYWAAWEEVTQNNKRFHPVAVKKANKAAVWASSKNRIDFNTVGLERKSIPVTAVVSHTLNSLKEEIAVDVMVKTGVRARRETHYIMKPITVVSPVVVRFA
jgi:hypothetical protein